MKLIILILFLFIFAYGLWISEKNTVYLPDGKPIYAEVAKTPEERARGLMFRENLRENDGMFFVFESDGYHAIWMKNMRFSIDVLWLDSNLKVVHIERDVPQCREEPCPIYSPSSPARYVLEVNANIAKSVKVGDKIKGETLT